jgi:predicted transposase YdaD
LLNLVETVVYRLFRLSREEIKAMLGFDTELKRTRFYQEVFAEGHQEGRQEGRQQESIALVLRQLKRHLGP